MAVHALAVLANPAIITEMRSNSKRQNSTPASRRTTGRASANQNRHKPRATQKSSDASVDDWNRPIWVGRPNTENLQDQPEPNSGHNASMASMPSPRATMLTPDKSVIASSPLRNKDQASLLNFGNDYSDAFLHRGILPQGWVQNRMDTFKGYPKLERLHELKREQFEKYAAPPVGINCPTSQIQSALHSMSEQHVQFDVIMVHGCLGTFPYERLYNLPLESLSSRPSFIFLWVPVAKIGEGRRLMEHWGFRKGEDIVYIVNSLNSLHAPAVDSWVSGNPVFRPTTWHCLMGLKGTVRRSTNTELIHCNVDTDVIFETPNQRANVVPEEIYNIIENFTSMGRKIHILPEESTSELPVRPRRGWVILSPDVFSMGSFNPADFRERHNIPVSREIDLLRPQTPPSMR